MIALILQLQGYEQGQSSLRLKGIDTPPIITALISNPQAGDNIEPLIPLPIIKTEVDTP